jgi:integrase
VARQPKPWFWKARGAWYVQVGGKQIRLAEDRREAEREFYRIMAAQGRLEPDQAARLTVADACEALIANAQHLRPNSRRIYDCYLGALAEQFGRRPLDSLRPPEVIQWIASCRGAGGRPYGESSRSLIFRYVKQLYRWCRDMGFVAIDPFVRTPNPWRMGKRDAPMSEEDYVRFQSLPKVTPQLKEAVEFIWCTGIRPGELAVLSARHLDSRLPIARFQPTEHKTGTRTGLQREVYFPAHLWERLKGYAERYPKGPLLRKRNGRPWTAKAISDSYSRLKKRHEIGSALYQARHRYATTMLETGVLLARVAKMMGHVNTDVLISTYYHPEAEQMAADVDATAVQERERIIGIQDAVAAERRKLKIERGRRARHGRRQAREADSGEGGATPSRSGT